MLPIYFDYAATTPLDPAVLSAMLPFLSQGGLFGNAGSQHVYGQAALQAVNQARAQVAETIAAEPSEIIFTSGATESINLAIKGVMALYQRGRGHIITFSTEHKAVLEVCQQLEKSGVKVTRIPPLADGSLDFAAFEAAFQEDTGLVSVMHVNNETGVIADLARVAEITHAKGALLHVDAAQTIGKLPLNVREVGADLVSLSAHKAYGPKGVGALYLRKKPRVRVTPLLQGGGQEQGMRGGTLPVHQLVGMGEAFALAHAKQAEESVRMMAFHDRLLQGISANPNLVLNASSAKRVPHILNIRCEGQFAETVLAGWPNLALSTSAACQGKAAEGSHVLRAMGQTVADVKSAIRISMGRFTTPSDIEAMVACLIDLKSTRSS